MTSLVSEVSIKAVDELRVLSLRKVIKNYRAQSELWSQVVAFARDHGLATPVGPCFTVYYDLGYKETDVDTEVCLQIAPDANVPVDTREFTVKILPALPRVASIIHTGSYSTLGTTYDKLFRFLGDQKETVAGPVREIYVARNDTDASEKSFITEIQAPLK